MEGGEDITDADYVTVLLVECVDNAVALSGFPGFGDNPEGGETGEEWTGDVAGAVEKETVDYDAGD
jgi:hypothetical protein